MAFLASESVSGVGLTWGDGGLLHVRWEERCVPVVLYDMCDFDSWSTRHDAEDTLDGLADDPAGLQLTVVLRDPRELVPLVARHPLAVYLHTITRQFTVKSSADRPA